MCAKSCDLLTVLQTYGTLLTFASKICAFFAPGSTVMGATVTSMPGSFGRTILKVNLKANWEIVIKVRRRTSAETTTTNSCCIDVVM
jgi:hypothetical protein